MQMRNLLLLFFLAILAMESGVAQAFLKSVNPEDYGGNMLRLAERVDQFYDTASTANRSGSKQWKRWEWFAMHHIDGEGFIRNYPEANLKAMVAMEQLSGADARSHTGDWFNLGHASSPDAMARNGRVNSVAFDPVNGAIIYVASAGGGIWKSFDNGENWVNLTIDLPLLGIADLVVSPAPNQSVLYALSGDIAGSANVYAHTSLGVFKSWDGGLSWNRTGFNVPAASQLSGYKMLMHPTNSNIVLAAMSDGIHLTTDGGDTWALTGATGNINDMEFSLSNPDTVFFSTIGSSRLSKLSIGTNGVRSVNINTNMTVDRMEIAVTPDNPNAVYVLAGPGYGFFGANLFNGLFYSNDSGQSFVNRSISCSGNGDLFNSTTNISWYANTIYVDPLEENYVIVGGLNIFNSVDGGVTLNQVTVNAVHADQHNVKRNPVNGHLWLCNDGGVYRSTNSGNTWENKSNGLTINEYYRISGTNTVEDKLLGGTQDNGHFLRMPGGSFLPVLGGDGMDNYVNSYDNTIAYASSQYAGLARSSTAGQSFTGTTLPNAGDNNFYPWIAPMVQYPPVFNGNDWIFTDVIFVYASNGIMRSMDGAVTWANIGPTGNTAIGLCPSMVIGRDGGGTNLYICSGNKFWVTPDGVLGSPIWYNYNLPLSPTNYVSAMAVNPANRNEIWITVTGYVAGTKVFRSFDAGITWTNYSLSLPNTPMYSITFGNAQNNPSGAVYVGTEIGVFYKDDTTPDWIPFSNSLPHVPVTDLQVNFVTQRLKAATYGRGVWESDLYEPCPSLILVDYDISQGQYTFESSNQINANHWINGGSGVRVRMRAATQIKLQPGFWIFPESDVRMSIGDCGTGILPLNAPSTDPSNPEEPAKEKREEN